ncbi:catechol 2,3-dioxygenase-like lactoylglutathione lyase family enzyme [Kribbella rubisoli]|uniref:Catechol 2,3-dioxygenase-like lactoylglutathione lyase family enzyme n=1 Tax=Kribbella rubisoli TaxID=3075929 RepID=A0A4Q7WTI1_9ACTN|nr:VOC family protein [Kribbella rubisoli]RZU13600.1 catechol 2,3-dioxygenase-like lactoylglutathione lyase family enzyme [Kribbella rubisoli]
MIQMDNVGIVVEDMDAAVTFFIELGLELEGRTQVEGPWADKTVGIDGIRCEIAMMRVPDGHGRLELSQYLTPVASPAVPENAPYHSVAMHRVMYRVDNIEELLPRLREHGAELVAEVVQYGDSYRLCYVRALGGVIVGLAEQLN